MTRTELLVVRYTDTFEHQLKRLARKYRKVCLDLGSVVNQLHAGETPGDQVQGIGYTVYKVRVRNSDARRGTSGGYRVIYYIVQPEDILLLAIYSKTDKEDISVDDIVDIIEQQSGNQ